MKIKRYKGTLGPSVCLLNVPTANADRIVRQCTFSNPVFYAAKANSPSGYVSPTIPETLEFAWRYNNELYAYRGVETFLSKTTKSVFALGRYADERQYACTEFPDMQLDLTVEQMNCMKVLETTLQRRKRPFGNLLFIASTAVGKTILQAAVAARLGQRTLVLCPTDLIMQAWKDDLVKAFNFTSKDVGIIKQKKIDLEKKFVLASVATLGRRRHLWPDINEAFGTVVCDEVQGVSAPTLFDFLSQSPAAYLVGATATQENRDGSANRHLQALFGEPLIEIHTYGQETATSMLITEAKLITTDFRYVTQKDNIDWNNFAVAITTDEERNSLVVANVKKEWEQGRVVLVVTKRREHADILEDMLTEAGVANVNQINGDTNADKFYTSRLLGFIKSRRVTCIVATAAAIQTGANIPALDSVHLAMPIANRRNLEQLLGRIRRKAEGKNEATLTYYFDEKVGYALHLFRKIMVPVFRKMKIKGYENLYIA